MRTTRTPRTAALLMTMGVAAMLTACSAGGNAAAPAASDSTQTNPVSGINGTVHTDQALAESLPAAYRGKTLTVGTDATNAPKEFLAADGATFQGLDIDFTYAIGNVLGLKMHFVNAGFDTLLPGVQNGRYDFVASSAAPTVEREKVVDFVSVDRSGESLLVKSTEKAQIKDITSLCGHSAGTIKGALEADDLAAQSAKCQAAGKQAIQISLYPDSSSVNLALSSGRVDAVFLDTPTSSYQAKNAAGNLAVVGPIYRAGLEGVFMKKGGGLAAPVAKAVNELIQNGTYAKLLAKWGLTKSVIAKAYVDPATNGEAN